MRVIDFIALGDEPIVYCIYPSGSSELYWRGTRKEFIWELQAFFTLYFLVVKSYTVDVVDGTPVLLLYV